MINLFTKKPKKIDHNRFDRIIDRIFNRRIILGLSIGNKGNSVQEIYYDQLCKICILDVAGCYDNVIHELTIHRFPIKYNRNR